MPKKDKKVENSGSESGKSQDSTSSAAEVKEIDKEVELKVSEEPENPTSNDSQSQMDDAESPISPVVEGFEIISCVGLGGMGRVFKARRLADGEIVALKLLNPEQNTDKSAMKKLEQEIKTCTELDSPHLVNVFQYGVSKENNPYIVMELVEGETLQALLKREEKLNIKQFLNIFEQALDGLAATHKKVLHRDLKPSNIMLSKSNDSDACFVKLVDFGIAQAIPKAENDEQRITQTGEVIGSPVYMSPEQCTGKRMDERADIYSLGCVMYEALTGRPPFLGDNVVVTILDHLNTQPKTFNEVMVSNTVPPELEEVVLKCLEKDPADRFQTVDELKEALAVFSESTPESSKRDLRARLRRRRIRKAFKKWEKTIYALVAVVALAGTFTYIQSDTAQQKKLFQESWETAKLYPNKIENWEKALAQARKSKQPDHIIASILTKVADLEWLGKVDYSGRDNSDDSLMLKALSYYKEAFELYNRHDGFSSEKIQTINQIIHCLTSRYNYLGSSKYYNDRFSDKEFRTTWNKVKARAMDEDYDYVINTLENFKKSTSIPSIYYDKIYQASYWAYNKKCESLPDNRDSIKYLENSIYMASGSTEAEKFCRRLSRAMLSANLNPSSFDDRMILAKEAMQRKDYDAAIVELRAALAIEDSQEASRLYRECRNKVKQLSKEQMEINHQLTNYIQIKIAITEAKYGVNSNKTLHEKFKASDSLIYAQDYGKAEEILKSLLNSKPTKYGKFAINEKLVRALYLDGRLNEAYDIAIESAKSRSKNRIANRNELFWISLAKRDYQTANKYWYRTPPEYKVNFESAFTLPEFMDNPKIPPLNGSTILPVKVFESDIDSRHYLVLPPTAGAKVQKKTPKLNGIPESKTPPKWQKPKMSSN